jgi:hypothetical protein
MPERDVPIQDRKEGKSLFLAVAAAAGATTLAWIAFLLWFLGRLLGGW